MDERVVQFRVGVVALATMIILAILIVVFNEGTFFYGRKTVTIDFANAPGVTIDTPIRKNGILVGRVRNVEFDDEGHVLVTAELNKTVRLYTNEIPQVRSSLLGDTTIEFVPGPRPGVRKELEDGAELTGTVVPDPFQSLAVLETNVSQAAISVKAASDNIGTLAHRIDGLLADNDQQFQRIVEKTELAIDNFNRMMTSVDNVLGDPMVQENLRRSLADLPDLLRDAHETIIGIREAVAKADQNLENLKGFTGPLGDRGEDLVVNIDSSVKHLDELLGQLAEFSTALNNPQGSLSQLVNNPDLYQALNRAALNIQEASDRLRPILNDVRIFTDKISRDPSRLGVGGAIHRNAPIK